MPFFLGKTLRSVSLPGGSAGGLCGAIAAAEWRFCVQFKGMLQDLLSNALNFMNLPKSKTQSYVWVFDKGRLQKRSDQLATEEPLEIRLASLQRAIAITMRTPGADFELAAGFLLSEGIISQREDLIRMSHCVDLKIEQEQRNNILNITLRDDLDLNAISLERHFYTSSACGVCGKTSLESLKTRCETLPESSISVAASTLQQLPVQLAAAQGIFKATGGLHAAALFDLAGNLLAVKEDVGRHNALDKLIGSALLQGDLPLSDRVVMVSGRLSFELVQKCLVARVPIVCAVSAPSSLAVELAQEFGMTLVGFLRGERFNVYSGVERITM